MKPYRALLLIATLFFLLKSCQKEDFSLPADVYLEFSASSVTALDGGLEFSSSGMMIHSFRFLGERNTASDIDFVKELEHGSVYNVFSDSQPEILVNIPRGPYEEFHLDINIPEGTGDLPAIHQQIEDWLRRVDGDDDDDDDDGDDDDGDDDDGDDDDGDDDDGDENITDLENDLGTIITGYLESIQPGMIMQGILTVSDLDYSVFFVAEDDLLLSLQVKNSEMTRQIILQEGENILQIRFDPEKWFSPLSEQILESAWVGRVNNERIIFIHKKINPELYTILLSRLEVAFSATKR